MYIPSLVFPEERVQSIPEILPLSPAVWYGYMTPTLGEIKMEKGRVQEAYILQVLFLLKSVGNQYQRSRLYRLPQGDRA